MTTGQLSLSNITPDELKKKKKGGEKKIRWRKRKKAWYQGHLNFLNETKEKSNNNK